MTALPIFLIALAALFIYLLTRSNDKLREREEARCSVTIEERVPAFQWPLRPRAAVAETHPRAHERVVPMAGGGFKVR